MLVLASGLQKTVEVAQGEHMDRIVDVTAVLQHQVPACPVGSGALRIRTELTRPGSTSRTRVRYIWRPHHVPQASDIVVAAAVTLMYRGSIRPQDSGLQTHCPLLRCACRFPRTARNRKSRKPCQVLVYLPGPPAGRRKGPAVHPTARSQHVSTSRFVERRKTAATCRS